MKNLRQIDSVAFDVRMCREGASSVIVRSIVVHHRLGPVFLGLGRFTKIVYMLIHLSSLVPSGSNMPVICDLEYIRNSFGIRPNAGEDLFVSQGITSCLFCPGSVSLTSASDKVETLTEIIESADLLGGSWAHLQISPSECRFSSGHANGTFS